MADDAEQARLRAMTAKPWRGACQLCWDSLWFADSESEIAAIMRAHLTEKHPNLVYWQARDE